MAPDSIQVIIPALNEEATIGAVVAALRAQGLGRIRVVDNGSTDGTAAVAGLAGAAVLREPVPGYGRACWRGYRELGAEVRWVLFCDADGSDDLKDVTRLLAAAEGGADDHPSFFEFMTAMAFLQFARKACDVNLIEVGMGGRLDATNILTPAVSVITSIGLDHCEMLGSTVELIA
eukprot:gene493-659_t